MGEKQDEGTVGEKMPDQVKVTIFEPNGHEHKLWTLKGQTVWEALEILGWDTAGSCGGQGTCGKCKFRISGEISELTPSERERLMPEEIKNGLRLACLAKIEGDFTLSIDFWEKESKVKSGLLRYQPGGARNSRIANRDFYIAGPQKDAPAPIYDRIKNALADYRLELSMANLNQLAELDRPGRPALELHAVVLDDQRIQAVGRQREVLYGLALDIGSTSLFTALVDLETGRVEAMASHTNMQRVYGEDIIARVNFAQEQATGAATLQRIVINNLNSMIEEMVAEKGITPSNIFKVTAVGNPVMLHLLLGLSTANLGRAPYTGLFSSTLETSAAALGLKVNPLSQLGILPQLGGFVGADTTACLLTLALAATQTYLLLDIGTNGEIVVNHRGSMWTASAAAGPALEGGAVRCGMRAGQGAVDKVWAEDGKLRFRVIGGGYPRGICGSGLIDLLAVLLQNGCLDRNGNLTGPGALQITTRTGEHGPEMILGDGGEDPSGAPLVFNQDDVRQLQLARSAIRTAIDILLQKADIHAGQLENIYLAGAFGSYVDPASVLAIGLLPPVDKEKIRNIGNAAAEGAIIALLDQGKFQEAEQIKGKVHYVELAEQANFQPLFLKNINF
jgi:uncharacterized 2Fe-2S/4Fe-4S cluster protein (DUF4445 family)